LQQKILEIREAKKEILGGINEILDESDKTGNRTVIKLKKDTDVNKVLDCLFKYTDMQVSYGINMVAIADGRPQQMGLLDMLAYYVNFQREVIYKRTRFDLNAAKERQHILQGLIIAVRNIDEVVKIIKTSENVTVAKQRLRDRFTLSDRQAQAILDMRLARLTSLEIFKLEQELLELEKRIEELTKILASKKLQFELVKQEMDEIKRKFKDGRRSDVLDDLNDYKVTTASSAGAKGPVENVVIASTQLGTIKCMTARHYAQTSKVWSERSSLSEVNITTFQTTSDKVLLAFSDLGNAYKIPISALPNHKFKDNGIALSKIANGALAEEKIVYFMNAEGNLVQEDLLFFTEGGMIKKTNTSEYQLLKSSYQAIKLKDGDKVIRIEPDKKDTTILFITKDGMSLNALKDDIPLQGRISAGVKGIALSDGDNVVLATQITGDDSVLLVSNKAYAKRVNVNEIDKLARYRKGVKVFDLKGNTSSGTEILAADLYNESSEIVVSLGEEQYSAVSGTSVEEDTRLSKGAKLSVTDKNIDKAFVRYI
ncbi:MAG: hypothetical protein IJS74_01115, partial [Clostridia bacterium]|nr:hypothetical protein [Clostridia bacterium]